MENKESLLKVVFGKGGVGSMIRVLIVVMVSLLMTTPVAIAMVRTVVVEVVQEELAPLKEKMERDDINSFTKMVEKNIGKMEGDPKDLKKIDLAYIKDDWEYFKTLDFPGKISLQEKVVMLMFYKDNMK